MPAVTMSSVRDDVGIACLLKIIPILNSVSGSMNCKKPVRESGILLVAKENISNGVTDTTPASQTDKFW